MAKTYIVDGNSLLFRAYYSTAYTGNLMVNKDGIPTNAIFAFHNLIKKIKSMVKEGDHLFIAFDTGEPTFRKKEFQDYKAQRAPAPQELVCQMPMARELLEAMNIHWTERVGYEADDLAGSMAKYASDRGDEVRLFTSDKDFLQLLDISGHVTVEMLKKGLSETICYTKENLHDLFGLNPDQIADFKGISGDPSDNYKGIKGVGEKTAIKFLNEYGHLEQILEYCKANPSSKTNQKFIEGEKDAIFFKELATIDTALDMKEDYEKAAFKPYMKSVLSKYYLKYQLNQFIKAIDRLQDIVDDTSSGTQMSLDAFFEEDEQLQKEMVTNPKKERDLLEIHSFSEIKDSILAITYDSNGENENIDDLLGYSLAGKEHLYHFNKDEALKDQAFLSWLGDKNKNIACYDLKGLIVISDRYGIKDIQGIDFDFLLASYLINPDSGQKREDLFLSYGVNLDQNRNISLQIISYVADLSESLKKDLKANDEEKLFNEIEMPLARVLAEMEIEGFPMDKDTLSVINEEYTGIIKDIEKKIYDLAGKEFNINSPKQLEQLLFTDLGINRYKGEKGTGIDVLKAHAEDHPIIPLIIEYRLYNKLISGYTSSLPEHLSPKDQKIHALYNQALTSTGRLSMSEPNLQNISIRNEEGKNIRKAFYYPNKEYYLLSLDYSQIELRVLASVGKIRTLQEIFRMDEDIHRATAAKVFNVPLDQVTSEMRRRAKAVNFGIVYGISSYGLTMQLGISYEESSSLIKQFKQAFEGIDEFQNECITKAREKGYVTTLMNRRRYLRDINSSNRALRSFSERAAVNTVIQGTAADLIKVAMVNVRKALEPYKTKIILQIHDELIFKVPKDEIEEIIPIIRKEMEHAIPLDVPLKVDGTYALDWYEAH